MKVSQLKTIVKEAVKEAIQEEIKDILLEAVKSPKQVVSEYKPMNSNIDTPSPTNPVATKTREEIRENYMNVLGGMMPGKDGTLSANTNSMPLQMNGPTDTTSPNGALPQGNVSMDQIMGLMNSR
jgi:hypothetical protein